MGRAGEIPPVSVLEFLLHNESALWDMCVKDDFFKDWGQFGILP